MLLATGVVCLVILSNKNVLVSFEIKCNSWQAGSIIERITFVVAKALVDKPDEVQVREIGGDLSVIFELKN